MQYFTKQTEDFEDIAQHLQAFDAEFRQLRGGKFQGKLRQLRIGPVVCMQLELSHAVLAYGVLRKPGFVFSPVTSGNQAARWRGHSLEVEQVNVLGPREMMDHVTSDNYTTTSLIVESSTIREWAMARMQYDIEEALHRQVVLRPGATVHEQMARLGESAMQAASTQGALDEERFLEKLTQTLLQTMEAIDPRLEPRASHHRREQVLRRAIDLIQGNLNRIVTMTELCRAAECSERTLQYAFQERYGLSPKEYMLIQRLNAVRREIKRTRPEPRALSRLTKSWGFSHHGEFAARYRHLFGELPRVHAGLVRV